MALEINILCLGDGLINCLDMLSPHDLKTCREVSQVFRRAVEDTNQRRLSECRDNSSLCSELQMRMHEHCFQEFHRDISPTALYWHTFRWMQTFVRRDNALFNNKAHDLAIDNARSHSSLRALTSIASVQQTENEQYLVNWLKRFLNEDVASIHEQVNQQTTSLDIVRLIMQCADAHTFPLSNVRDLLNMVIDTRNRPCLEFFKFDRLNQDCPEDLFVSVYDIVRNEPEFREPVTERIPHRSICTPTVIAAASICAILSIGAALFNSL